MMAGSSSEFAFLHHVKRAPGKRQIKPKAEHQHNDDAGSYILYGVRTDRRAETFGNLDDEDDSDSEEFIPIKKSRKGRRDSSRVQNGNQSSNNSDAASSSSDDAERSDDDEEEEESSDESFDEDGRVDISAELDIIDECDQPSTSTTQLNGLDLTQQPKICNLCLNLRQIPAEISEDIAQCDSCGMCVHETCYGLFDNDYESLIESFSPGRLVNGDNVIEAWFCDTCCANVDSRRLNCELCPNTGGVFKQTDTGKWVHLMCALYIKGVSFGDTRQLNNISLYEMDYRRYGAKPCAYCDDKLLARTGVVTQCDAGLCKTHFHITCAERLGLLIDQSTDHSNSDPYFGCCNKHSDKDVARSKAKIFERMTKQCAAFRANRHLSDRERKMLTQIQKCYSQRKSRQIVHLSGEERWSRYINSSAEFLPKMIEKCQLEVGMTRSQWQESLLTPSHFSFVPPAFSSIFFHYFTEREATIVPDAEKRLRTIEAENEVLRKEIAELEDKMKKPPTVTNYKQHATLPTVKRLVARVKYVQAQIAIHQVQHLLKPPHFVNDAEELFDRLENKSLRTGRLSVNASPNKTHNSSASTSRSQNCDFVEHQCASCKKVHNQHQLTQCDTCQNYYHIGCLDPPLTKVPAKTAIAGWECSRCAYPTTSNSEDERDSIPNLLNAEEVEIEDRRMTRSNKSITGQSRRHGEDGFKRVRRSSITSTSTNSTMPRLDAIVEK